MEQTTAPEITPEMITKWQQQQALAEQQRQQQLINSLITAAAQAGYEIVAIPQFTADGRIGAGWGVRQKDPI